MTDRLQNDDKESVIHFDLLEIHYSLMENESLDKLQ